VSRSIRLEVRRVGESWTTVDFEDVHTEDILAATSLDRE
jgi:hypothetical protein